MSSKQSFFFIASLLVTFWLLISFSTRSQIAYSDTAFTHKLVYSVSDQVPSKNAIQLNTGVLFLDNSYVGFKEAIAFKESQGNYSVVNTLGYLGKYQFGVSTLDLLGIKNKPQEFLNNPALQEKAFLVNTKRNKWVLRRDIKRFVGKKINGIRITESGILAAAHLAGPGNVKRYLRSFGALEAKDAYVTDILTYMRKFSSYDTSFITAQKKSDLALP